MTDSSRRLVLGLGSNLGDRGDNLRSALRSLGVFFGGHPGSRVLAESALYETPPAGGPPQPDYWNGAVLVSTNLSAREVLRGTLEVERSLGRIRPDPVRWGPRTIDIDFLWIEGEEVAEADLWVPHPRLSERVFALRPLLDVAPFAAHPRTGERYADLPAAKLPIKQISPKML